MNNKDRDLKNALDDIFGSDSIEIDVPNSNIKKEDNDQESIKLVSNYVDADFKKVENKNINDLSDVPKDMPYNKISDKNENIIYNNDLNGSNNSFLNNDVLDNSNNNALSNNDAFNSTNNAFNSNDVLNNSNNAFNNNDVFNNTNNALSNNNTFNTTNNTLNGNNINNNTLNSNNNDSLNNENNGFFPYVNNEFNASNLGNNEINNQDQAFFPDFQYDVNDINAAFNQNTINNDNNIVNNKVQEFNESSKNNININPALDNAKSDQSKEKTNKNFFSLKRIIIYFVVGFLIGFVLIYVLVNYVFGVSKVTVCSQSAKDVGYEYTDEYKITYKKDKILYVESDYNYKALTDEFKSQINYVKDEKLLAVINSNGMPGFTYVYEVSDDHFKVNGYLDFELINFDKVDDINQDLMPISYFKIDSKLTYSSLISNLEDEGYKCTPSK